MKLRRANGLNICGVVALEVLRMLQRLRTALCSDQSDVCILKKLRKGTWLFQVISVSLGTHGPQRKEKCLYPVLPIVWVKNTSEEARTCLGLLGKHLLSTSLGTCLESDVVSYL